MTSRRKRDRLIERLRRTHGGEWVYEPGVYGQYFQKNTGRRVKVCAAFSPRFDGDDDTFTTRLYWTDTQEGAEWPS